MKKCIIIGAGDFNERSILKNKEDLLIVAFNDARKKADEESNSSMSDATGGLNLKNMKLPF